MCIYGGLVREGSGSGGREKDLILRRLPGGPNFGKYGYEVVIPRRVTMDMMEYMSTFNT